MGRCRSCREWLGIGSDGECDRCRANRLGAEVARLQAIVDELPKCWRLNDVGEPVRDVPVVPGMATWCNDRVPFPHYWELRNKYGETFEEHCKRDQETHYSTREAASAASEEEGG